MDHEVSKIEQSAPFLVFPGVAGNENACRVSLSENKYCMVSLTTLLCIITAILIISIPRPIIMHTYKTLRFPLFLNILTPVSSD